MSSKDRYLEGADIILSTCGAIIPGERLLIICDVETRAIGDLLLDRALNLTSDVSLEEIPVLAMHGEEPPRVVAERMCMSDLCVGLTSKSMAHTRARRDAALSGARYLSLPDYSLDLLGDDSLRVNFHRQGIEAKRVSDMFTAGSVVRVTTGAGTDISMAIQGRIGNCCPGYVNKAGELGSPPDIEANVSPIEDSAEGVVVVDGSIPYPGLGLIGHEPVTLVVANGRIQGFRGNASVISKLEKLFLSANSKNAYVLAECGVGLNDKAKLNGVMLTDEGSYGTMHFGFGSNYTVGGLNEVSFHLDFVFNAPTLRIDGITLISCGKLQQVDG